MSRAAGHETDLQEAGALSTDTTTAAQCGAPASPLAVPAADEPAWPSGSLALAGHIGSTLALSDPRFLAALDRQWTPAELWVRANSQPRHASADPASPDHAGIWQPAVRTGRHAAPDQREAASAEKDHAPTLPAGVIPPVPAEDDPAAAAIQRQSNAALMRAGALSSDLEHLARPGDGRDVPEQMTAVLPVPHQGERQ